MYVQRLAYCIYYLAFYLDFVQTSDSHAGMPITTTL